MNEASLVGLCAATVSFGALLYLAALGEMVSEKAGILNLGVEGMMAMGAVTGFMTALEFGNPWLALAVAVAVGALTALLHGWFTVVLGAEQVVSGLSLTILGAGPGGLSRQERRRPATRCCSGTGRMAGPVGHPLAGTGSLPAVADGLPVGPCRCRRVVRAESDTDRSGPEGGRGSRRRQPTRPATPLWASVSQQWQSVEAWPAPPART